MQLANEFPIQQQSHLPCWFLEFGLTVTPPPMNWAALRLTVHGLTLGTGASMKHFELLFSFSSPDLSSERSALIESFIWGDPQTFSSLTLTLPFGLPFTVGSIFKSLYASLWFISTIESITGDSIWDAMTSESFSARSDPTVRHVRLRLSGIPNFRKTTGRNQMKNRNPPTKKNSSIHKNSGWFAQNVNVIIIQRVSENSQAKLYHCHTESACCSLRGPAGRQEGIRLLTCGSTTHKPLRLDM